MSMNRETIQIVCENCDSEYKVTFDVSMTDGGPEWCPFCGTPVTDLDDEEHGLEDDADLDDDDEGDERKDRDLW